VPLATDVAGYKLVVVLNRKLESGAVLNAAAPTVAALIPASHSSTGAFSGIEAMVSMSEVNVISRSIETRKIQL
jgi:hypothetical protein